MRTKNRRKDRPTLAKTTLEIKAEMHSLRADLGYLVVRLRKLEKTDEPFVPDHLTKAYQQYHQHLLAVSKQLNGRLFALEARLQTPSIRPEFGGFMRLTTSHRPWWKKLFAWLNPNNQREIKFNQDFQDD